MSASRSSLAKFIRIAPQNVVSKSPPKTNSSASSMSRRKHPQPPRSISHIMDDSDDDYSFFRSRREPRPSPLTLVAFYDGSGSDVRGRTLEEILQWDAGRLERSHDYIQTLFPLPEKSGINDLAPIINQEVFDAFHERPELKEKLRGAFKKMLWFYGFELVEEEDKLVVRPGPNIEEHSEFWNTRFDHNHLRITRIIRCLRVLGLEKEALAFYDTISCASSVSSRSRMYWQRAAYRQLNFSPDLHDSEADPEDARVGPKFLFQFERQRKELEKASAASKEEWDNELAIQAVQSGGQTGGMKAKGETIKIAHTDEVTSENVVEENQQVGMKPDKDVELSGIEEDGIPTNANEAQQTINVDNRRDKPAIPRKKSL